MRMFLLTGIAALALTTAASAASVDTLKGSVFISTKNGFVPVKTTTKAWPGQTVLVKAGGFARAMCSPTRAYEMAGPGRYKIPADCKVAKAK
jgi:hypothetical protein